MQLDEDPGEIVDSVRPLTLKDDYDYEDNTAFMMKKPAHEYPPGFSPEDDLDGDGQIDQIENDIKVEGIKEELRDQIDENVRN